jgi:hypothetical protein
MSGPAEIIIILVLVLLNGIAVMAGCAMVPAKKARHPQRAFEGDAQAPALQKGKRYVRSGWPDMPKLRAGAEDVSAPPARTRDFVKNFSAGMAPAYYP